MAIVNETSMSFIVMADNSIAKRRVSLVVVRLNPVEGKRFRLILRNRLDAQAAKNAEFS